MTGRGEGYCVLELPEPGRLARGYAGLTGYGRYRPPYTVPASPTYAYSFGRPRWGLGRGFWGRGRCLGWGRGWGPGRGRGWWW